MKGGYSFNRSPREITVREVVECVDGSLRATDVAGAGDELWNDARVRLSELFEGVSIADLAEREALSSDALMFHI